MHGPDLRSRARPGGSRRRRPGLWTEALESRRLLVATPINVASGLAFAIALPVPGLATGMGLASTAQTLPTATVSVSPAAVPTPFGPSANGPSTTLSPLPNDSETAVATASEVARPTPGRSDRISSIVEAPEIILLPHLRSPDPVDVVPGPEIQARPPAPAPVPEAPAQPPAEPVAPARPVAPVSPPVPEAASRESQRLMNVEVWDVALDLVATDLSEDSSASHADYAGSSLAAGALLAAWGGWRDRLRVDGRSRRRPLVIATEGAGRGDGSAW